MGVHGLWELLAPVGRRVSVETLAGKKLAIDASIWMIQFMKAMRDERGEMVRNAHILGFFRRICKLLFLRTKPVFVFDGATPALKRRTVIARRRQRENAQAKIRKTAEKLLLNHLKAMRLKELANELENQRQKNGDKGKRVITEEPDIAGNSSITNPHVPKSYDQEAIDAMLAASIAAEEGEGFIGDASTSGAGVLAEDKDGDDDDDDDDEEMLLPTLQGKVDPAVLAALPPSMQLDLLVQMRERLMAENRQKYQKVKKAPASFSELQIQAYLKTVAFRREIDEVRKAASGRGIGGVQTSRIASEANREFIFSSSFTGDRQALASAGVEANRNVQTQIPTKSPSTASVNGTVPTNKSMGTTESVMNEPIKAFNEDVETYLDERGRVRVSKVRAMGIRMTRDLQRNLDLMKEIEQERIDPDTNSSNQTAPSKLSKKSKIPETSYQENAGFFSPNETNQESISTKGTTIELSFEDDNEVKCVNSDDDIFARIVVGDLSVKQSNGTISDCEWEEGVAEDNKERTIDGCRISDESDVEWEEGPSDDPVLASACEVECRGTVSRGALLEEADIQEAIRRSMEEMSQKNNESSSASEDIDDNKNSCASFVPENLEKDGANDSSIEVVSGAEDLKMNKANNSPKIQLDSSSPNDSYLLKMQMKKSAESYLDVVNPTENNGVEFNNELHEEVSGGDAEALITHISSSPNADVPNVTLADVQQREVDDLVVNHVTVTSEPREAVMKESKTDFNFVQKVTGGNDKQKEDGVEKFDLANMSKEQVEMTKASLEEEMVNLSKERTDLGDEQKRLERNAESVSGEMFAECQELLQMFGLPYIIAPMEAEAQCAFMELENLVDGVVTDDSDVFLFGSRSVYKNIFDDRKYVETYFMKDIETELGLTREKLIRMAMLLGSDYTEGISGIGIVNAVEVLNAFPEEDGLQKFREWIESPDPNILGKVDNQSKRGSNSNAKGASTPNQGLSNPDDDIQSMKQIFMDKHRNVSKNWHIPSTFPSDAVVSAYASPQVDKSTESFSWGKPDLFVLRKLCWEKFGWGTQKADELLQPVLKEYNKHETQLRLEAFYTFNERFAKIRSKRINKAVKGIAGSRSLELMDDNELDVPKGRKRRKVTHMKSQNDTAKEHISTRDEANSTEKSQKTKRSTVRGRGKGQGQSIGRGRRPKNAAVTSSDDENDSDDVQEANAEEFEGKHEVRRSKRARKSVKYTNDEDIEIDERRTEEDCAEATNNGDPSIDKETLINPPAMAATVSNDDKLRKPSNESRFTGEVGGGVFTDNHEQDGCHNDETTPEYLKVGGGFCLDETNHEQEGCQNDETTPDYLKVGGGFCLDEDEAHKEPKDSCCSPITTIDLDTGMANESNERSDLGGSNVGSDPVVGVSQGNVEEDDTTTRPVSYFSAIPNLRRKRRKI